jgi:N-acetylmuramoyl-L-alanine amidase
MPASPRPLPTVERCAAVSAGRARGIARALCILLVTALPSVGQPASELTVISRDGRRPLPTVDVGGRNMVALTELMEPFGLRRGDDRQPGRLTLLRGSAVMVLTAGDGIVSVAGRLESLSSPPVERGGTWYVPTDFIGRALPLISDQPVELRPRSGLVIVGDVRVPQVVARYQRIGRRSRLRLVVTPSVEPRIERAAGQLLVTFEADAVDLVMRDFAPDDLLRRVTVDDRRARLDIELGDGFGSFAANSSPALGGSLEVAIDLGPAVEAREAPPPAPDPRPVVETEVGIGEEDADLPALADFAEPSTVSAIAIDAGHGGADAGTRGPEGTLEKDVTLGVARRLQAAIQRRLGLRVVLTRSADADVTLDERAAIANNNRADLFISLHANASMRDTATGAEVFYLSPAEYEDPGDAPAGGERVPVVRGGTRLLDIVRWERAQLRFVDRSALWAQTVAEELRARVPMSPRGVQEAPLRVLVGANMPAALVEMGFISNPGQEVQLASPAFQDAVVEALLQSIIRFRDMVEQGFPEDDPPAEETPGDDPLAGEPPADGSAPLRRPLP